MEPCTHGIVGACPICAAVARAEASEAELRETAGELAEIRGHWKQSLDDRERVINLGMAQAERLAEATALLERCRTGEATDTEIADYLTAVRATSPRAAAAEIAELRGAAVELANLRALVKSLDLEKPLAAQALLRLARTALACAPTYDPNGPGPTYFEIGEAFAVIDHLRAILTEPAQPTPESLTIGGPIGNLLGGFVRKLGGGR